MAEIKNEYSYSTSVKSNLLFNEQSELQEKKYICILFYNTDLFLLADWPTGYCSHWALQLPKHQLITWGTQKKRK